MKEIVPFYNLQSQNILDLELHELRPILYPKSLHLIPNEIPNEIPNVDEDQTSLINSKGDTRKFKKAQSLKDIHNEHLRKRDETVFTSLLLDDRCIVGYIIQRHIQLNDYAFQKIKDRFYKIIRYTGRDYSKKLCTSLLNHSLANHRLFLLGKNVQFERVGLNTQWKISFTNFIIHNYNNSVYEWLNHIHPMKLRELGLVTIRNYLNQQMIKQNRTEFNNRVHQELKKYINQEARQIKSRDKQANLLQDNQIVDKVQNLNKTSSHSSLKDNLDDILIFNSDEPQFNLSQTNVQNVFNELSCLLDLKCANQFYDYLGNSTSSQHHTLHTDQNAQTYQQKNKFELNVLRRARYIEQCDRIDIIEEEKIRNMNETDDIASTLIHHKQKDPGTKKLYRQILNYLEQNFRLFRINCTRFLRRKGFEIFLKYEQIQHQPIVMKQLIEFSQELSSPIPANVPYCQIGKSSIIAALKQFNWEHTQGPFIYSNT